MWRAQRNSFRTKPRLGATLDRGHSLSRGLRAFWLLNEGLGESPRDLVGALPATFSSSPFSVPSWTGGRFGSHAVQFGSSSYLLVGSPAAVDFTTGTGFTCSFAARCDTVPNFADGMIASKGTEWFVAFNGPSTGLRFVLAGGGGAGGVVAESRSMSAGEYSIWSVTYNRTSKVGNIYRDGALVATATLSAFGDFPTSSTNLALGSNGGTSPWVGTIDWISFHDRDLGAGEIVALHAQPFANVITPDSLFSFLGESAGATATTIAATTTLGFTAAATVTFAAPNTTISASTTLGFTATAAVGFGVSIAATTTLGFTAAASVTFTTATTISASTSLGFTAAASVTFTTSALTISAATTLGFTAAATVTFTTATTISASTTLGFTAAASVTFGSANLTISATTTLGFTAAATVAFTTATTIAAATTLGFTAAASVTFTGTTPATYATELEAIEAFYAASPDLVAACSGRFYFVEAPEKTVLPYITYMLVSRVPQFSSGNFSVNRSMIQFSVHDRLPTLCETLAAKVRTVFDKAVFPIGQGDSRPMNRVGEGVFKAEGKAPGGKDCWMQTLDYDLIHFGPTGSGV